MSDDENMVPVFVSDEDSADVDVFDDVVRRVMSRHGDGSMGRALLADRMVTALGMLIAYGADDNSKKLDDALPRFFTIIEKEARDCFTHVAQTMAMREAKDSTRQ